MKQILMLTIIGFVMLAVAGCASPAVNTPTPTPVPSVYEPSTYVSSPTVTYYPSPTPTNVTAHYSVSGSVALQDGTTLKGYAVDLTCYGSSGILGQYYSHTDANGSYAISFSAPLGQYDRYSIMVVNPSGQTVYLDDGTRALTGNETADIVV